MRRFSVHKRLLIIAILFFSAAALPGCEDLGMLPAPDSTPAANPDLPGYEVYFTQPENSLSETYRGGPDEQLVEAIGRARLSVDMAAYNLNLWSVRDALLEADQRGVTVRLVVESDNSDEDEIKQLKEAGIPVLGDRREGLMHDKFAVIDRSEVWTGSMNFTLSDTYRNNNNLIRLRSQQIAEAYSDEFEEMFVDDLFGPASLETQPFPWITLGDKRVEVYFSPDNDVSDRLVALVWSAKESIHFLAYSFTQDELADALLQRSMEGIQVTGVMEARQVSSNIGSDYERFQEAGLDVRLDANPNNMHHKVLIIDSRIVIAGSYNFSRSAEERNDENVLVIHDPVIASLYLAEFQKIFDAAGQ